jgi:hypothetical protein
MAPHKYVLMGHNGHVIKPNYTGLQQTEWPTVTAPNDVLESDKKTAFS